LKKDENTAQDLSGRRAAIVEALNKSVEIFTAHEEETFDGVMTNGIRPFADAVGLDRVVFYKLLDIENGKRLGQVYRWDKSEGGLMPLADELRVLPNHPVLEEWISIASRGGCIRFRKSEYTEDVAAFLRTYGIISILMVPIFTHGEFWGVVNFQDHTNDRYFDEGCSDLLYTAARIFSNAVIREEMKRRERMEAALNRAALMFLSHSEKSFEDAMTAGVKEIADVFSLDRFSLLRNFTMSDGLRCGGQIYRWNRNSGGTTAPIKGLESFSPEKYVPNWRKIFASGGTINGPVRLMPEADVLQSFGLVSICVTPVVINNAFWGIAFFEDLHAERFFEKDSVEIMRLAAFLCANTVIRADMERDITNANEFNKAILAALPVCITIFDENAHAIDSNDSNLKTLETTKKYYVEHFHDFSPEYQSDGRKSKDKAIEVIKRALNGENVVFEWTHCTSRGELIPFEVTLSRVMNKGKYVAIGYQYDLRNIKKMEKDIREQGEQLKIKLEQQELISELSRGFISSGDSQTLVQEAVAKLGRYHNVSLVFVFAMDYQHKDTYLAYQWTADGAPPRNAITNLYGYLNSIFPEILPDCATVPIVVCDNTALNSDAVFQALYAIDVMAVIGAPLYVDGRLWGVMCVEQSDTPRKWTENEKELVAMTASTIAGVIMRDIYTIKLKDALNNANAASKAKSDFLSNMSHEMRTPLNAITGMTAIGKNAKEMERKDYALDKIQDASTHLLGVINDVLDMSKIEANMLELSPGEFNFEKMLQKTVSVINFRVDEKKQKLVVHIDNKIPKTLIADDQRLAQVVTNLLSNAVKFTPEEGSIILDANFMGEENGLCTVQVSVSDTGIGISSQQQKRLFSSFQQAESSTTRKYGGTGLGLAISKNIVEMMGGKIWIDSEPGKGATFAFTIQARRGVSKEKSGLLASDVNLSNIRIMAIDDDPDILAYFRDLTQGFGVICDTVISGEEALRLVDKNGSYHIYFVDWKMPGMDGIQLTREIKARKPEDSVVIMISATEWSAIAEEAKKAGVDKFLPKPLFPSVIAEIINECLGVDRQKAEERQTDINGFFAGRRILLVEDVEINREIVLALLEPTQLEIDCAENGVEAVRMFKEAPDKYELIFMDVQMPEMDGYEATRRIRELKIPEAVSVPIIAMTANVFREDIEKCLEAGMDSHVGKPLDFEEVMNILHSYLTVEKR
jgi:two-component system, sensor histidine kinase and response regulator